MHVIEYESKYEKQAVALLAALQDFERALSPDRTPGAAMAPAHFEYLLRLCDTEVGKLLLALAGEEVAGLIIVFLESEEDDDLCLFPEYKRYGYVSDLIVREDHRGSEAANLLMKAAEQHCAAQGVRRVKVTALSNNPRARRFYQNSGYNEYEITFSKDIQQSTQGTSAYNARS
jgi:ribosomal protein S18 acetylase RimI-like enzyme